jgi:hypothetical protein
MTYYIVMWLPEAPEFKNDNKLAKELMPIEKPPMLKDFMGYNTTWDEITKQRLPYKDKYYFGWNFAIDRLCEKHNHRAGYICYYGWMDIEKGMKQELDEAARLALGLYVRKRERYREEGRNLNSGWVLWGDNHDCSKCDTVYAQLWRHALKRVPPEMQMWTIPMYAYGAPKSFDPLESPSFKIKNLTIETNPLFNPKAIIIEDAKQLYYAQESITLAEIHEPKETLHPPY